MNNSIQSPDDRQEAQEANPCFRIRPLTKKCPLCGAEAERNEVLVHKAVNDRDEDKFSSVWTCSGCEHEF